MAIPASGAISLGTTVPNEFGGANPDSLSEYYRNGAYVTSNNTGVPTSGTISLSQLRGTTAQVTVTVTQANAYWTAGTGQKFHGYIRDDGKSVAFGNSPTVFQASNKLSAEGGSRTPTTLNGATVWSIYNMTDSASTSRTDFCVVLSGNRASSFFTSVKPQGGSTLSTASVDTHFYHNGNTCWIWEDMTGSTAYITGWDGSGTRTCIFVP